MPAMSTASLASSELPPSSLPVGLDRILRETSRSVYLTLRMAPRSMRRPLMLGYLFCRAADTIADTSVLPPPRRVEILERYRGLFLSGEAGVESVQKIPELASEASGLGFSSGEKALLKNLDGCFEVYAQLEAGDQGLLARLLETLTEGMETDLKTFPSERDARAEGILGVLDDDAALDRYCYHVAGCVGEFWTELQAAHLASSFTVRLDHTRMLELGVSFGKGLQMTNVLRDMPDDLRNGRCYLPRQRLETAGVEASELRAAVTRRSASLDGLIERFSPVLDDLLDLTLAHYRDGWEYTLSLPRRAMRARLACAWTLLIGLDTLALLRHGVGALLSGERLKIARSRVYRLLASSTLRVLSNRAMDSLYRSLERGALRRPSQ